MGVILKHFQTVEDATEGVFRTIPFTSVLIPARHQPCPNPRRDQSAGRPPGAQRAADRLQAEQQPDLRLRDGRHHQQQPGRLLPGRGVFRC